MKLGEIKAQSISIMYPSAPVKFDDTDDASIIRAIAALKSDPNYESIIEATVGAINRCFSRLETLDLSQTKCHDIPFSLCEVKGDSVIITPPKDFLKSMRLLAHRNGKTYVCGVEIQGDKIVTDFKGVAYTLVYKTKIPRITRSTSESYEIDLSPGICDIIPYYIKADLLSDEREDDALEARDMFEKHAHYLINNEIPCSACFQIIYALEQE